MSDRWVFLAAFLTLVLIVAGAFAIPQFFVYELLTSSVFVVVAVMVFFGEDKFPYMLGIMAPILWFIYRLLGGAFIYELKVLARFLSGHAIGPMDTPLHGFAILSGLALLLLCIRAWRKQITEKFFGKTFALATSIGVVWIAVLVAWQYHKTW
jgi:hypothetical protein